MNLYPKPPSMPTRPAGDVSHLAPPGRYRCKSSRTHFAKFSAWYVVEHGPTTAATLADRFSIISSRTTSIRSAGGIIKRSGFFKVHDTTRVESLTGQAYQVNRYSIHPSVGQFDLPTDTTARLWGRLLKGV